MLICSSSHYACHVHHIKSIVITTLIQLLTGGPARIKLIEVSQSDHLWQTLLSKSGLGSHPTS